MWYETRYETMKFNIDAAAVKQRAGEIKMLALDVDGVLTDGQLYFSNSGEEMKAFNSLDGYGIGMAIRAGLKLGIVTGRRSELVAQRAAELNIPMLIQGQQDKLAGMKTLCKEQNLKPAQVCYVGDDLPDLPAMKAAGLALTVPGAHADIRAMAAAVTDADAGHGAVREIIDFLLQAGGLYPPEPD